MNKKGFTLIEVLVSIVIVSMLIVGAFKAYGGVLIGKIKLIEKTDIQKQAFYFSEKFFEELKRGGTIDFEEYFNRKVVGTQISSGHYLKDTGFGNYGRLGNLGSTTYGNFHYYCRSKNGNSMGTGGCVKDFNTENADLTGKFQRYGQYAYQFVDFNYNEDDDGGDEDGNGKIMGDYDDEYLGEGPTAFSGTEVKEIYLISSDFKKRTIFRWNIKKDPDSNKTCDYTTGSGGCASTIEFLKLEGQDWGKNHDKTGSGAFDGNIDTWLINKDFAGQKDYSSAPIVAGSNNTNYRQPLFGDNINVKDVKFFIYPNKDFKLSWKVIDPTINFNPYIRIQMTLIPTAKARKGIKGKIPEIKINTTVNLTGIYSQ